MLLTEKDLFKAQLAASTPLQKPRRNRKKGTGTAKRVAPSAQPGPFKPMPGEIWKLVPGHHLEASNLGRIKRVNGGLLKKRVRNNRHSVSYFYERKTRNIYVSKAVLLTFFGEADFRAIPGYKDGDTLNDSADNLFWRPSRKGIKITEQERQSIIAGLEQGKTMAAAARENGFSTSAVRRVKKSLEKARAENAA